MLICINIKYQYWGYNFLKFFLVYFSLVLKLVWYSNPRGGSCNKTLNQQINSYYSLVSYHDHQAKSPWIQFNTLIQNLLIFYLLYLEY
jgi:hypothetical protein